MSLSLSISLSISLSRCNRLFQIAVIGAVAAWATNVLAADGMSGMPHEASSSLTAPPPFSATLAKPFPALMDDAMNVMNYGMGSAAMSGNPDHDFAAMMIPHHWGVTFKVLICIDRRGVAAVFSL